MIFFRNSDGTVQTRYFGTCSIFGIQFNILQFTHQQIQTRKCFDGVYLVISRYIRVLHKQEVGRFSILYGKLTWERCQFTWHSFISDTYAYRIKGDMLHVPRVNKLEGILIKLIFWYLTEVFKNVGFLVSTCLTGSNDA